MGNEEGERRVQKMPFGLLEGHSKGGKNCRTGGNVVTEAGRTAVTRCWVPDHLE